jgi:uncharacterized tellurite resistance protein B-like protein
VTDWFKTLTNIVNRYEPSPDPHALPRAATALLLEMAVTDEGADRVELDVIHQAMATTFGMAPAELASLIEQAHQARRQSVSLYEFTRELRLGLEPGQSAELVEWLWRVAFADARLDKYEELMVRRVADLLGVPHGEFIRRKLLAKAESKAPVPNDSVKRA